MWSTGLGARERRRSSGLLLLLGWLATTGEAEARGQGGTASCVSLGARAWEKEVELWLLLVKEGRGDRWIWKFR